MIETELVETKRGAALGVKIMLCEAPLLLIRGENGYLACGYFDSKTVEKMGDCAAIVPGAKSFSDMLKRRVQFASKKAQKLGVKRGMTGARALDKLI